MDFVLTIIKSGALIYTILILARVISSWIHVGMDNPLVGFVYRATEPVLGPLRNFLPDTGPLDLSPAVALIGIVVIEKLMEMLLIAIGG